MALFMNEHQLRRGFARIKLQLEQDAAAERERGPLLCSLSCWNAKSAAGLSTRPLTAESFGQRLAESISWEGGVMQELMQAGRRSTGRSHLDTPDHLSADHSNLHPSLSVALWNEVKFNYIDIVAMQSLALICVKLLQRSNLKPPRRAWKSQLLLFLAPL